MSQGAGYRVSVSAQRTAALVRVTTGTGTPGVERFDGYIGWGWERVSIARDLCSTGQEQRAKSPAAAGNGAGNFPELKR